MYLLNWIKFSFPRKLYVLYNSDPSDFVLFPSFSTFATTSLSITVVSTYFVFENSMIGFQIFSFSASVSLLKSESWFRLVKVILGSNQPRTREKETSRSDWTSETSRISRIYKETLTMALKQIERQYKEYVIDSYFVYCVFTINIDPCIRSSISIVSFSHHYLRTIGLITFIEGTVNNGVASHLHINAVSIA